MTESSIETTGEPGVGDLLVGVDGVCVGASVGADVGATVGFCVGASVVEVGAVVDGLDVGATVGVEIDAGAGVVYVDESQPLLPGTRFAQGLNSPRYL